MPKDTRVTVPIEVILRRESLDRFSGSSSGLPATDIIAARAMSILEGLADGGLFLTVDQIRSIEKVIGSSIRNGNDVVAAAQKGAGVEDGKAVYRFALDPSFVPPLQEIATVAGRTVEALIQETVDLALENQWTYNVSFEGSRRTFSPVDEEFFAAALGKDFTVSDLHEYVKSLQRSSRKQQKQESEHSEVAQ